MPTSRWSRHRTAVTVSAIIGLVVIELSALAHGINGTLTSAVCAIIGGLAGYTIKR